MSKKKTASSGGSADAPKTQKTPSKRNIPIKVFVNKEEIRRIEKQKGRLSKSAFLRDRGLNRDMVYDPTYASIGSVYQSARNLRDSAAELSQMSELLLEFDAILRRLAMKAAGSEEVAKTAAEISDHASKCAVQSEHLEQLAKTVSIQARDLARTHMAELLDRHPAYKTTKRRRR